MSQFMIVVRPRNKEANRKAIFCPIVQGLLIAFSMSNKSTSFRTLVDHPSNTNCLYDKNLPFYPGLSILAYVRTSLRFPFRFYSPCQTPDPPRRYLPAASHQRPPDLSRRKLDILYDDDHRLAQG